MHRCLYVSEIVALIAESALEAEITESEIYTRDWGSVAALARTCKTLQDPASDVLWRDQVELTNLVKCLPQDVWEERECDEQAVALDGWKRKLYFTRPLEMHDLERIQQIATRIRSMYFLSSALTDWSNREMARPSHGFPFATTVLSKAALEELNRVHPTSLMPKLRMLWLGDQSREEIFTSPALFSSTIRTISMTIDTEESRDKDEVMEETSEPAEPPHSERWQCLFGSALDHARTISPELVRLDLIVQDGIAGDPIEFPGLDNYLLTFVHLQILTLEGVVPPFSTFSRMHSLPNLRELQLGTNQLSTLVDGAIHVNGRPDMKGRSSLPSLKGLFITGDNDLAIIPVLSLHRMPMLREFLASAWFETPDILVQCLHDHLDHNTLTSLHLDNLQDFDPVYDNPEPLTGAMLAPLLAFRNMKMLFIHGSIMRLLDEDLRRMAVAWPALQRLSMCSEFDVSPCRVTLAGLRHLVKHCPLLRVLEITFSLEHGDEQYAGYGDNVGLPARVENANISRIHVGMSSPEGMPPCVAAKALAELFPRLKVLDVFRDHDSSLWKSIESYLPKNRKKMLLNHERLENNVLDVQMLE